MIHERQMPIGKLLPIDVWVTPNVLIHRQLSFWHDEKKNYIFVPSGVRGFVIITAFEETSGCEPLQAFIVHRPAALELSWLCDKTVVFREISMFDARLWELATRKQWKYILP